MFKYNSIQNFVDDSTQLAIQSILRTHIDFLSSCGDNFKKTISFDHMVHFIDDENILTYVCFDCGTTFDPKTFTTVEYINHEGEKF